jgi:hypothetical protein
MLDDEFDDDRETLGYDDDESDSGATDFSSQNRRAPGGLDFSSFGERVAPPTDAARPRGSKLDFSGFGEKVSVPTDPPLPRARPRIDQSAEPQAAPSQPSTAAGVPLPRPRQEQPLPPTDEAGMVEPGNIDLTRRKVLFNADGSYSTERSMTFNDNGHEVVIPTVAEDASRILSEDEAIEQYRRTGKHLGKFIDDRSSQPEGQARADLYAERVHKEQQRHYGTPAAPDYVADLEGGQFRTGSKVNDRDNIWGSTGGMLTGEEAYKIKQEREAAAEAELATARAEREAAEARFSRFKEADPEAPVTADPRLVRRSVTAAQKREQQAQAALTAIKNAPLPTQTRGRNIDEAMTSTVFGSIADTADAARGIAELIPDPLNILDPDKAREMRAKNRKTTDDIRKWAEQAGKPDPGRADDFETHLASGAASMGMFMLGGAASRALRLPGAVGSGGLGAFQMGGQQLHEAENAIKVLDRQIEATKTQGLDATELEAKREKLLWTKYVALIGGMGLGATEAIPVERFFNRLNQVSKGRLGAILANTTAQSGEELLQEIGQTIGSNTLARLIHDEGRDIFKDVNQSAAVALVLGGLMGAGSGLVSPVRGADAQAGIPAPIPAPMPAPGTSPIEEVFRKAGEVVGAPSQPLSSETGVVPAGDTSGPVLPPEVSPQPGQQSPPEISQPDQGAGGGIATGGNISAIERRVLRKKGWDDEDIDAMSRAEAVEELGEAAQQRVEPDEETAPATPAAPPVPEQPTAEPASDIMAQVEDLKAGNRQAVWLPKATVDHLMLTGGLRDVRAAGQNVADFDGQGGLLITADSKVAEQAIAERDKGGNLQAIIGKLTNSGTGKPPGANTVIQQKDEQGNVTRESLVENTEIAATAKDFAEPGKTVEITTGPAALGERAEKVEGEAEQAMADLGKLFGVTQPTESQPAAEKPKNTGPEIYTITDPLAAKTDGETWDVQVLRDKDGKIIGLDAAGHISRVAPAHQNLPPEQAIAETLGDHPQGAPADPSKVKPKTAATTGGPRAPEPPAAVEPSQDATAAVEQALSDIGIPPEQVDPTDIQSAAELVEETGVDPATAFVEVMAEQTEETTDAEQQPVSESVEDGAQDGQAEEGELVSGGVEDGQDQAGGAGETTQPGGLDFSDLVSEGQDEGPGDAAEAEDAGVEQTKVPSLDAIKEGLVRGRRQWPGGVSVDINNSGPGRRYVAQVTAPKYNTQFATPATADTEGLLSFLDRVVPDIHRVITEALAEEIKPAAEPEADAKPTKTAFVETEIDKPAEDEKARLEDAGEKLGGARKDAWGGRGMTVDDLEGMSGTEKFTKVKKEAVWPRPDYAALVENGMDATTAFLIKRVYDNIPTTPQNGYTFEQYVEAVGVLRAMLEEVKAKTDLDNMGRRFREAQPDIWRAIEKRGNRHHYPGQITYQDERAAEDAVAKGFPNIEPWKRVYRVTQFHRRNDWAIVSAAKKSHELIREGFETKEEAEKAAAELYEQRSGFGWAKVFKIQERKKSDTGKTVWHYRRIDEKEPWSDEFATVEEVNAAVAKAYEAYNKKSPDRPHLDNIARKGPDVRNGRDINSEDFKTDFGFRGVEFGNYVAGDERQKTVNLAYDALHDLARIFDVPPKALSLNGTLGVGFGSRGRGGKVAAHYEPHLMVINMTKVSGAGALAHEWAHALDHYLGETDSANAYGGAPKSVSGWYNTKVKEQTYRDRRLANMTPRLNRAANAVMQAIHFKREPDEDQAERQKEQDERGTRGLKSWQEEAEKLRAQIKMGGGRGLSARLRKAEQQIGVWTRHNERQKRIGADKKWVETEYYKNARILSGSGDYWYRPTELFARAFESYIFDRIAGEGDGHISQYLVQGVEPNRFGTEYKGNPYPAGDERAAINTAFDEFVKALQVTEGKHGDGSKIIGKDKEDWKTPEVSELWQTPTVTDITPVKTITTEEKKDQLEDEMQALDDATKAMESGETSVNRSATLAATFANHLREGNGFANILAARKMAKEAGFGEDAKSVEEAMELALVMVAREIVADRTDPKANFTALVDLYSRQPKLGTRTSTSMRDQAYSTPVPLAYVASRLAGITPGTEVYEPTAGNGALLIETAPENGFANELNPDRRKNLESQGFKVAGDDASDPRAAKAAKLQFGHSPAVVIANPPFGAVRQEGDSQVFDLSDIQQGYKTHEIDHAISHRALAAMHDQGTAVLILGGINKLAASREARSDAYNSKAKREFYKTLYDRYNVTDHFTVAGELYERQGAGWPVDVIVIEGRGKSSRKLPAADVPRVLTSWDQLGGLLDGLPRRSDEQADRTPQGDSGVRPGGGDGRDGGDGGRVSEPDAEAGPSLGVQSGPVQRPEHEGVGQSGQGTPERGQRGEPGGYDPAADTERRPSGIDEDFGATFDAGLDELFGPDEGQKSSEAAPYEISQESALDMIDEAEGRGPVARKPRDTRPTSEVAKSAVKNVAASADEAMAALTTMFGGGKTIGMGLHVDPEKYEQAKPIFVNAAKKFIAFKDDIGELIRRMQRDLRDTFNWTREMFVAARPYFEKFIEDVKAGLVKLVSLDKPEAKPASGAKKEQATATQLEYQSHSKSEGLGTLVPVNMQASIDESLADLEKRVGSLDAFVATELGYETDKGGVPYFERDGEVEYPFAGEQIDALALALDNMKRGKGFIIGDQTGIGKGRVNAGVIRWAIKNGNIPIFTTKAPNLYGDMYRDLTDIGMEEWLGRPLRLVMTNGKEDVPLSEDGKLRLKTINPKVHNAHLATLTAENFREQYDVLLSTYNQAQTVKGEDTVRRELLARLAPHAVLAFDESHEAGGQAKKKKKAGSAIDRAEFAREQITAAKGTFYSSATYAKRPDVMDLYAATDMSMAVEDPSDLGEAIAKGGVPMQQVVAAMLAKAGQYIRRERSFAGVSYDTVPIEVDREQYDGMSGALALIQSFSKAMKPIVSGIDDDIKGEAEATGYDNATGEAGASSTAFTSSMHNLISQILLALKAKHVAKMAIEAIKRGEKPVITLANTMGSIISELADDGGITKGNVLDVDFSAALVRYLDRSRTIIIKKPFSADPVERKYLSDEELGPVALAAYNRAKAQIESLVLTDLAISPIDRIKQDLMDAGYSVGEITGRGTVLDYSGEEPVLQTRSAKETSIAGRRDTIRKFNTKPSKGGLHAIILNQAGATGLSLHASEKFDDQSQRHMMIAQAEANIDTHMQMLGRVHRTGQVIVPKYSQLFADIPAEKRPAAVLAKKMASLNANTTASRGGALTAKDVPDFMNEYGDRVAATIIADDLDLYHRLAEPGKMVDLETGRVDHVDAMRHVTGRIPLLQLTEQEELYERLEAEYASLLEQKTAMGENALEAQTVDLKAQTLERTMVVRQKEGGSVTTPPEDTEVGMPSIGPKLDGESWKIAGQVLRAASLAVTMSNDDTLVKVLRAMKAALQDGATPETAFNEAVRPVFAKLLPILGDPKIFDRIPTGIEFANAAARFENAVAPSPQKLKPQAASTISPFAMPVFIEKASVVRQGKPFSPVELMSKLSEAVGGKIDFTQTPKGQEEGTATVMLSDFESGERGLHWGPAAVEIERKRRAEALKEFAEFQRKQLADIAERENAKPLPTKLDSSIKPDKDIAAANSAVERERTKLNAIRDRWETTHQMLRPGARITIKTTQGNFTSIVLKVEKTGKTVNPLALSAWKATFALASAERQVQLPFSRLYQDGMSNSEDDSAIELRSIGWTETPEQTLRLFAIQQNESKETRYIATGNLLAAYDYLNMRGRIINYTTSTGGLRQGVLTPKDFDLRKHYASKARPIRDPAEVVAWLKNHTHEVMASDDDVVRLMLQYGDLMISAAKSKRSGGVYFLDKPLTGMTGDFSARGPVMRAYVQNPADAKLVEIVKRLQKLGAVFVDRSDAGPPPTEVVEQPKPDEGVRTQTRTRLTAKAEQSRGELQADVLAAIEHVAGRDAAQRTMTPDKLSVAPGKDWNVAQSDAEYESTGVYYPGRETINVFPLIGVALADNPNAVKSGIHEGWHAIEGTLAPAEVGILRADLPYIRKFVIASGKPADAEMIAGAEAEEIWAEGAAHYAINQSKGLETYGLPIRVRRIFAKIARMLLEIRNALAGRGFRSYHDVFEAFGRGEMAIRREALPPEMRNRWWSNQHSGAVSMINAWHGSPHDHDKFSTEKIGTGEGAQVYGWGLYFAGKKEVAEYYKRALSPERVLLDGQKPSEASINKLKKQTQRDVMRDLVFAFMDGARTLDDAREALSMQYTDLSNINEDLEYSTDPRLEELEELISAGRVTTEPTGGKLYNVNINTEIDHMLDYDKSYEQQSAHVKAALEKLGIGPTVPPPEVHIGDYKNSKGLRELIASISYDGAMTQSWRAVENQRVGGWDIYDNSSYADRSYKGHAPREEQAREWIEKEARNNLPRGLERTGRTIYRNIARERGGERMLGPKDKQYPVPYTDEQAASMALKEAGIPGIKYFDGGSRNVGDGTHNYVVFDDSLISIEAKTQARRRPAAPGDVIPPPETVGRAWAASVGRPWKERVSDAIDALLLNPARVIWDKQIDLLRFGKAAEMVDGSPLAENLDSYLAASLFPGRAGERMKDVVRDLWHPIYDAMRDRKVGRDELHEYLYARHAPERNAAIREIDPSNDEGSGMSDAEAADIMAAIDAEGRTATFEAIAKLIDDVVAHNRQAMVAAGLESQDSIDAWLEKYDNYVPLKGFESGEDDEFAGAMRLFPTGGQGFSIKGPESKRALGRFDRADDILANLLDQTQRTVIRAEKNKVAKTFLRFARTYPSPYYKIGLLETKRRINPVTGMVETYVVNGPANRDEVFAAKVGGKTYFIEIKHPGLLNALKSLGMSKLSLLEKVIMRFGRLTREFSRLQTAKNPEFFINNFLRDVPGAAFNISAEEQERFISRFFKNLPRAMAGSFLGTTETGTSRHARQMYDQWREDGGKISHYGLQDLEGISRDIERELKQRGESKAKGYAMAPLRFFNPFSGSFVRFIEAISDILESTTRLAVYMSAIEIGMTRAQAANMARNASTDFNRGGQIGHVINALYSFSGANIQGNVNMMRRLRKSKVARRAVAAITTMGFVLTLWNLAVSPEDEEKKRSYQKLKYWEREASLHIYLPGAKRAIKYPMPFFAKPFFMAGEQAAMWLNGKVGSGEALGNVLGTLVTAFNPLGWQGSAFDVGAWTRALFPTVLRPLPELATNKNWTGRSIHPDPMPWTRHLPPSDQHKAFTHSAAIGFAELMNRMTGGNKFEPGFISLYPDDIQYGWDFALGGLGRFINNTTGSIKDYVEGADRPAERLPFVRSLIGSDKTAPDPEDYYKARTDTAADAQRLRRAVQSQSEGTDDGSADAVIDRLSKKTGARATRTGGVSVPGEAAFRKADKNLKQLRLDMQAIRTDKKLSTEEKRAKIDGLRIEMQQLMRDTRQEAAPAQ